MLKEKIKIKVNLGEDNRKLTENRKLDHRLKNKTKHNYR